MSAITQGKATIGSNGVNTDLKMGSANAEIQIGGNPNVKLDPSGDFSADAKIGSVEANLSVNLEAAATWVTGVIKTIVEMIFPEIIIEPHKYNDN